MSQIEIDDQTFRRLQALAKPLIDTPSTVINRLIDYYEQAGKLPQNEHAISEIVEAIQFEPEKPPPLTHTKVRYATIGDQYLERASWNQLVRAVLKIAFKRAGTFEQLRRLTDARIVNGTKTDEGFSPLDNLGFSVQGVDAQEAFRILYGVARKLSFSIEISFEWRDKVGAHRPGKVGTLAWAPSK